MEVRGKKQLPIVVTGQDHPAGVRRRIFGRIFLQIPRPVSLFISLPAWLNLNLLPVGGWGGQIGQIPETTFSNLTFTIQVKFATFNNSM